MLFLEVNGVNINILGSFNFGNDFRFLKLVILGLG